MSQGYLVADGFVSLAAAAGLLVLIATLRRRHPGDGLVRRLLFGLGVLVVILVSRVLVWAGWPMPFNAITLIAAGMVPLAALLLSEGLLRQHAPVSFKYFTLTGAVAFAVLAWLPGEMVQPWRLSALLLFQLAGFLAMAWLLLGRDRSLLSSQENRGVDRIALSLLLIVPLLATDFRFQSFPIPVRLAGIAVLAFCWLALGLGHGHRAHRDTVMAFLAHLGCGLAAGATLAQLLSMDATQTIQTLAVCCAAVLLAAVVHDALDLRTEERRRGLLRLLAEGDTGSVESFLGGLQHHAQVDGLLLLRAPELGDFDADLLRDAFAQHPLLRTEDVAIAPGLDDAAREQLDSLVQRYGASHLMRVSQQPLTLAALNLPALAATPGAEAGLAAVQRMADLISQRRPA